MEQRRLGTAGPTVGALCFGCMGLSGVYRPADPTESEATLLAAIDAGANLLDTADEYGPFTNESSIGRIIAGRRDEPVLAPKFGQVTADGKRALASTPAHIRVACDASLARLGVDHIDLYLQHRVDPTVPIEEAETTVSCAHRYPQAPDHPLPTPQGTAAMRDPTPQLSHM